MSICTNMSNLLDTNLYSRVIMIKFNNTYQTLPTDFYQSSEASFFKEPKLIIFNYELANQLSLNLDEIKDEELASIFSGQRSLEGSSNISLTYAGHQFGHFVPQLGDGRALLMGEVTLNKRNIDIQLKGSGPTAFSRRGDGKSSLGPVIREYLLSEAMYALGIPTTRALAAISTGEQVYRSEELPGGVFTRVAKAHIRVGTFEYFFRRGDEKNLKILADYTIKRLEPELENVENKYFEFFKCVARKQIDLVCRWMGIGFIHGVMNTDNTSIAGETIDYGPCAFMDHYTSDKVFSSIDRNSRYAYSNQLNIVLWNLSVLAQSLLPLMKNQGSLDQVIMQLENEFIELEDYSKKSYLKVMCHKIGIDDPVADDMNLITAILKYLERNNLDFTNSFLELTNLEFPDKKIEKNWLKRIANKEKAVSLMTKSNPRIIARNHLVEKAVQSALDGDYTFFYNLHHDLKHPFTQRDYLTEGLKEPPTPDEIVQNTFCGT